jgi:hypothetical protein
MKHPRQLMALILSYVCVAAPVWSQNAAIEPIRPEGTILKRPYRPVEVPPARLSNSAQGAAAIRDLIRGGKLYLTAQDAVNLALANNIDIEVARYNQPAAEWQLERVSAGGALAGVPSSSAQAFSVASGQGVQGSQQAAGVSGGGGNGAGNNSSNASISQVGPVTAILDPVFQENTTFGHQTTPQQNTTQSLTQSLISNTRASTGTYQQGFLSGGQATVTYKDNYLNENSPTDILNPSTAQSLAVTAQQNLLRGFGRAVNERNITVARINLNTNELNFKTQVIGVVVNVLDNYYALVADYEDVRAKTTALNVARQFFEDPARCHQCRDAGRRRPSKSGSLPDRPAAAGTAAQESDQPDRGRRSAAGQHSDRAARPHRDSVFRRTAAAKGPDRTGLEKSQRPGRRTRVADDR